MTEAEMQARVIAAARGWIGTPYRHQASLRGVGCDCLGLLRGVWREAVGPEPEPTPAYPVDWVAQGSEERLHAAAARHLREIAPAEAGPGRVLLFRWRPHLPAMHCGVLTAPGRLIHAHEGACVAEVPLAGAWARRVSHAFAFPLLDSAGGDA
jgi:NlpC/P60 family putative phage cell wall peptidase